MQVIVLRTKRNNKVVNQANGPNRIDVQKRSQTRINPPKEVTHLKLLNT